MTLSLPSILKTFHSHRSKFLLRATVSAVALIIVFAPEGWASDTASKLALTTQMNNVQTLFSGPVAKLGLTGGVVVGTLVGIFKHSIAIVLTCMGIGIALSYYMHYLNAWGT